MHTNSNSLRKIKRVNSCVQLPVFLINATFLQKHLTFVLYLHNIAKPMESFLKLVSIHNPI